MYVDNMSISLTGSYLGGISLVNFLSASLGLPQNSIGINPQQGMHMLSYPILNDTFSLKKKLLSLHISDISSHQQVTPWWLIFCGNNLYQFYCTFLGMDYKLELCKNQITDLSIACEVKFKHPPVTSDRYWWLTK